MLKKVLALAFAACMSISCISSAVELLYMGELTKISYNSPTGYKAAPKHDFYFDGDTIEVNRYRRFVDANVIYTTGEEKYGPTDIMKFKRYRIFFKDTPEKSWVQCIQTGKFSKSAKTYDIERDYVKRNDLNGVEIDSLGLHYGALFLGPALYKEFGPLFDMPNYDGSPYQTPKGRGLAWIKSTADVGVFYDPRDVKVDAKNNTVSAKVVFWIPDINRIEEVKGKFDYTKQQFKSSSAKLYRINTGELTESHKQGLFPGILGEALPTFRFGEDENVDIAAEFFKQKLAK